MSVVSVNPRSFILALFIRDDGERFLLGDNGYDFKNSQLHFAANTIENDEVVKQGTDGTMLAGQVRRSAVQSFDGYVGDATMLKETIEQMRRDFFAFFVRGHHFRVIYVDCNRNAWQRKGGYLVDAPEVKELWQIHPEYHVGLNFEDVNYYSYDEDADGEEILSNLVDVPVSTAASGGLVWDEDGAVSEDAEVEYIGETSVAAPAKNVHITDATEAPLASFQLDGEMSQNGTPTPSAPVAVNTTTGENVVKICGKNLLSDSINTTTTNSGTTSTIQSTTWTIEKSGTGGISAAARTDYFPLNLAAGDSITISSIPVSGSFSGGTTFPQIIVYWYDANKTQLGYTTTASTSQDITAQAYSKTYTASSNVAYFRIGEYIPGATTGTTTGVVLHLQLELGSTATAYEPYQGQSYAISLGSIELCKIGDYQDYIYKSGGKWYVHKAVGKYTFDGSENWFRSGRTTSTVFCGALDMTNYVKILYNAKNSSKMDRFVFGSSATIGNFDLYNGTTYAEYLVIMLDIANVPDVTAAKAWVAANKPTVYGVLATSTEEEITNAALIAQLEAVLGGHTYAGTNNIFTVTPNEQGTLEISYYTKYQPMVVSGGYVWEAGGAGGATIVVNNSIDNVNPIWKIYGPTMNPQLENSTTGEVIEYVGLIAEGQTLTIDMGEQTASLDGLNVISNLVGDFISLAPGANRLIYSVSGDAGASEIGWSEIVG